MRVDRGLCDVVTPAGIVRADTEFVVPRDPMKVVCTGDWVAVDPEGSDPDGNDPEGSDPEGNEPEGRNAESATSALNTAAFCGLISPS